jgi:ABC-type sugar transport system ATPase subunit
VGAKAEIHDAIRAMAARGIAIILISSELPEILSMSTRVAVMRDGVIAAVLGPDAMSAERILSVAVTDAAPERPRVAQ